MSKKDYVKILYNSLKYSTLITAVILPEFETIAEKVMNPSKVKDESEESLLS